MLVRAFTPADIRPLATWFPTPDSLAQWGSPARRFPLQEAEVLSFLAETSGPRPRRRMWAGEVDGVLAATATTIVDRDQGVALLAMVGTDPAMRGRGLAKPLLRAVIDDTFSDGEVERLELNVYTFNAAAIRTYEGLGFVREGVRRSLARLGPVRWDAAHYALLRADRSRADDGPGRGGGLREDVSGTGPES